MIVECDYCGKEVNKSPSDLKNKKHVFCNQECHYKWRSENTKGENNYHYSSVKYKCDNCNKEFLLKPYILKELKEGNRKNIFCCRECHNEFRRSKRVKRDTPVGGKFEIRCQYCDKVFLVNHCDIKRSRFCSKKCKDKFKVNKVTVECLNCEKKFKVFPSMSKNRKFCSMKCNGEWCGKHNTTKIRKICAICGREYRVSPSWNYSITCSKRCQGLYNLKHQKSKDTKPELMVKKYLIENNIKFIPQRLLLRKYVVDFYLSDFNIVIEVQGNYWHGNPEMYGDGEGKRQLTEKQKDRIEKDRIRYDDLVTSGYNTYFVWEKDIYEDIDKALSFLNLTSIV